MSGVGGAVAVGADGDLQVAAFDEGGGVKIAQFRHIDHITQNFQFLTVVIDLLVQRCVVGGGDDQGGADEIIFAASCRAVTLRTATGPAPITTARRPLISR